MTFKLTKDLCLRVAGVVIVLLVFAPLLAAGPKPAWWAQRGATNSQPADDYAVANLGQLKQMALKARDELNSRLKKKDPRIEALIEGFNGSDPAMPPDDHAAATLGQLKAIAEPFYDRLMEEGFTGYYPWHGREASADDSALANIGQLKNLFSFDLRPLDEVADQNKNGIPDWWEHLYVGRLIADSGAELDGDGLPVSIGYPAARDSDGDGLTDEEETELGTSLNSDDTDSDGIKDKADRYPRDNRRSSDIPVIRYATIDISTVNTNGDNIEMVAVDNNHQVSFARTNMKSEEIEIYNFPEYRIGFIDTPVKVAMVQQATRKIASSLKYAVDEKYTYYLKGVNASGKILLYVNLHAVRYDVSKPIEVEVGSTSPAGVFAKSFYESSPRMMTVTDGGLDYVAPYKGYLVGGIANTGTFWGIDSDSEYNTFIGSQFFGDGKAPGFHFNAFKNDTARISPGAFAAAGWASPGPYVAGWKNGLFPIFDNADTETVVEAVTDYGEILGFSKHFPVTEYFTHPEPLSEHPFWLSAGRKIDFYFALPPEFQRQIAFFRRSDVSELPEFKVIAINEVGDLLFLAAVADDNGSRLTWRPALLLWERARNSQLPQLHEMELPAGFTVKQMTNNHVLGGLVKKIALDPENNPIRDPENPDLPLKTNRAAVLFPGEMMVDGNRDGKMSFFDRVIHHDDAVTKEKPYRFWLNNDHDIHHIVDGTDHEWDDASDNIPDSSSNVIFTPRDLEDYSRIRINFKGFTALAKDPTASVWIEWRAMDGSLKFAEEEGTPEIKFYQEKRPDMTPLYLEDEVAANEQLEAPYNSSIGSAIPGIPLQLFAKKSQLLEGFSEEAPVVNLLFCGITAGRGQLTLTIKRKNKVVVEFPPLYLELLDIKDMYERWSAGEDPKVAPRELSVRSLTGLPSGYKQAGHQRPFTYNSKDREEKKYILFVHGWNMTQADKDYFADTAYKRLFWQGYKGRFGSFEWPTTFGFGALLPDDTKFKNGVNGYYSVFSDPTCFDRGEFNAWRSSLALKRTFRVLNHHYPGNVNVLAHSMGNVVVGEALRCAAQEGLRKIVRSYVATQAAIPAHCYNGAVNAPLSAIVPAKILVKMLDGGFPETPNVYLNWLGANARAVGERVNFYNQNDYSLAQDIWHLNQYLKPDHYVRTDIDRNYTSTFDYRYKGDVTLAPLDNGFKKYSTGTHRFFDRYLGNAVDVKDRYEIMAFAAEARSKPLGSIPAINGFRSVNLQSLKIWPADTEQLKKPHSAHKWHSAQFRSTNMRQKGYWKTLLGEDGFKINTTQP